MNKRKGCERAREWRAEKGNRKSERRWFSVEERESVFIFGVSPQAVSLRTERDSVWAVTTSFSQKCNREVWWQRVRNVRTPWWMSFFSLIDFCCRVGQYIFISVGVCVCALSCFYLQYVKTNLSLTPCPCRLCNVSSRSAAAPQCLHRTHSSTLLLCRSVWSAVRVWYETLS